MRSTATRGGTEVEKVLERQLARPVIVMVSRGPDGWTAEVAALGVERRARSLVGLGLSRQRGHQLLQRRAAGRLSTVEGWCAV